MAASSRGATRPTSTIRSRGSSPRPRAMRSFFPGTSWAPARWGRAASSSSARKPQAAGSSPATGSSWRSSGSESCAPGAGRGARKPPSPVKEHRDPGAAADPELSEDGGYLHLDRVGAAPELRRDLARAQALAHPHRHLALPRAQAREQGDQARRERAVAVAPRAPVVELDLERRPEQRIDPEGAHGDLSVEAELVDAQHAGGLRGPTPGGARRLP